MGEILDIFDERGNKTGERMEKETAIKSGKLIKAFQIWIIDSNSQVLVQKRANTRRHDAGKIDLLSGHVQRRELESHAVQREIKEELGPNAIKQREFQKLVKVGSEHIDFRKYGKEGNYIVPWYLLKLNRTISNEDLQLEKEEVDTVQWIDYETFKNMIINKTPNLRIPYLPQISKLLEKLDSLVYQQDQDRDEDR